MLRDQIRSATVVLFQIVHDPYCVILTFVNTRYKTHGNSFGIDGTILSDGYAYRREFTIADPLLLCYLETWTFHVGASVSFEA